MSAGSALESCVELRASSGCEILALSLQFVILVKSKEIFFISTFQMNSSKMVGFVTGAYEEWRFKFLLILFTPVYFILEYSAC